MSPTTSRAILTSRTALTPLDFAPESRPSAHRPRPGASRRAASPSPSYPSSLILRAWRTRNAPGPRVLRPRFGPVRLHYRVENRTLTRRPPMLRGRSATSPYALALHDTSDYVGLVSGCRSAKASFFRFAPGPARAHTVTPLSASIPSLVRVIYAIPVDFCVRRRGLVQGRRFLPTAPKCGIRVRHPNASTTVQHPTPSNDAP